MKYTGDSVLGVSLTVETPKPLDCRAVVSNVNDLYDIPSKYAYEGMVVACVANGNQYVLIDKTNIANSKGWKASYESIQIITCTQAEYDEWKNNTDENNKAIDESLSFIHQDTYYYIYEDSLDENQFYLSAEWGKSIEEQLSQKALNSTVQTLKQNIEDLNSSINTNLNDNYVTKEELNTTSVSTINSALENYYNKAESLDTFVTKESLKGDTDEDDFVFLTQKQYISEREKDAEYFASKTISTNQINLSDNEITIEDRIHVGDNIIPYIEDIPEIKYLTQDEYDNLEEKDSNVLYLTYGDKTDKDTGYVRSEDLAEKYYTKAEVDELINQAIAKLQST